MAGKGDTPRPVDKKKYDEGYERIFSNEYQLEPLPKEYMFCPICFNKKNTTASGLCKGCGRFKFKLDKK